MKSYLSRDYGNANVRLSKVGYGDIHPVNYAEHVVCIGMMLVGGVVWAYLIGVLTAIVTNLDRHGNRYKTVKINF